MARVGTRRIILGLALGLAAAAVSPGCATKTPAQVDTSLHAATDVSANVNQIRLKMRSLVDPLCGEIESTADRIAAGTTDPAVRKAALRWKIEAVPALREALFQANPFVALSDAWVLSLQMADYFENGAGKTALGASAPIAVETCHRLERRMAEVAAATTASGDVSAVRAFATKWAAEHPIEGSIQARESTLGRALERDYMESWSGREAAVWIAVSFDDFNRRLEVLSRQLPRQARWEAELVGGEMRLAEAVPLAERVVQSGEKAVATLDRVAPQLERTLAVAESAPGIIAAERKAAIEAFGAELLRTTAFLQHERMIGFQQVTQERVAALAELRSTVTEERKALDEDLQRLGRELVDHAFRRLAQLVAATLAAIAVLAFAGMLLAKRLFFKA